MPMEQVIPVEPEVTELATMVLGLVVARVLLTGVITVVVVVVRDTVNMGETAPMEPV